MAKARTEGASKREDGSATAAQREEETGLLAQYSDDEQLDDLKNDDHHDATAPNGNGDANANRYHKAPLRLPARIPSPVLVTSPRTPRSANRVRFDLTPSVLEPPRDYTMRSSMDERSGSFEVRDDYDSDDGEDTSSRGSQTRRPLLTDIEAPSVTVANGPWGEADVHEWADEERRRPKSGLRSAFMNMANSIIGAGIIGQPYALRQAGLFAGIALLVGLTVTVDWTIRLIVINSKLSGANSFQGTVQHCFGKPGLIAISVAQWAFAFGGMVAFGVIVGDTIPHVLEAIWPSLREMPVFGLLADRRVVIVVFVLGISYPLTLYRDIAKVRAPDGLSDLRRRLANLTGWAACESEYACTDKHGCDYHHRCDPGRVGPQ